MTTNKISTSLRSANENSDNNSDNFVSYDSDWMLGKMTSALYLFLLAIGWDIDAAALSMISGSGKMDN